MLNPQGFGILGVFHLTALGPQGRDPIQGALDGNHLIILGMKGPAAHRYAGNVNPIRFEAEFLGQGIQDGQASLVIIGYPWAPLGTL
jgi:hypothetical protein